MSGQDSNAASDSSDIEISKKIADVYAVHEKILMFENSQTQPNNPKEISSSESKMTIPDENEMSSTKICKGNTSSEDNGLNDSPYEFMFKPNEDITRVVEQSFPNAEKEAEGSEIPSVSGQSEVEKRVSRKDIEQAFITVLKSGVADPESPPEDRTHMTVPDIKITDASDIEGGDSDTETLKDESETVGVSEVQRKRKRCSQEAGKESMVEVDKKQKARPSTSDELHDESATSYKERRATFYISSSELQRQGRNATTVAPEADEQIRNSEEVHPCLYSKKLQGCIITASIFISAVGIVVSDSARKGSAPEAFEIIGLSISLLFGIVGILSIAYCFILTFLNSNEALMDMENLIPSQTPMLPGEYNHEKAVGRQNMSFPRTSAAAVGIQSKQDKTDMAKKEIASAMELLTSALIRLEKDEVEIDLIDLKRSD